MDLSHRHYQGGLPQKRSGKFVQIIHEADEYIVLAPKDYAPFHANIVERFCEELCISGGYYDGGRVFRIHAPGWVIAGGGRFDLDTAGRTLSLSGESLIYGRFDDSGLLKRLADIPELAVYEIVIS